MINYVRNDCGTLNQWPNKYKRGEHIPLADQLPNGQGKIDPLWDYLAGRALQVRQALAVRPGVRGNVRANP